MEGCDSKGTCFRGLLGKNGTRRTKNGGKERSSHTENFD